MQIIMNVNTEELTKVAQELMAAAGTLVTGTNATNVCNLSTVEDCPATKVVVNEQLADELKKAFKDCKNVVKLSDLENVKDIEKPHFNLSNALTDVIDNMADAEGYNLYDEGIKTKSVAADLAPEVRKFVNLARLAAAGEHEEARATVFDQAADNIMKAISMVTQKSIADPSNKFTKDVKIVAESILRFFLNEYTNEDDCDYELHFCNRVPKKEDKVEEKEADKDTTDTTDDDWDVDPDWDDDIDEYPEPSKKNLPDVRVSDFGQFRAICIDFLDEYVHEANTMKWANTALSYNIDDSCYTGELPHTYKADNFYRFSIDIEDGFCIGIEEFVYNTDPNFSAVLKPVNVYAINVKFEADYDGVSECNVSEKISNWDIRNDMLIKFIKNVEIFMVARQIPQTVKAIEARPAHI